MRTRLLITVTVLLTLGAGGVQAQEDAEQYVGIDAICGADALQLTTAEVTLDDKQAQALDAVLLGMVTQPADPEQGLSTVAAQPPAPGAVVLVESPSGRYFRSIGVTDVATCETLEPTTPFAIGSHTKMFVAAVVYQLQEEGLLSTSDLVSAYLPDQISLFPRSKDATIDHLLTHTAGLPDFTAGDNPSSLGQRWHDPASGALGEAYTPERLIAETATLQDDEGQPAWVAGDQGTDSWAYANIGFDMLGMIIEQVTGKPWEEAVQERVLEPLGLDDTVLVPGVAPSELGLPSSYFVSPFTVDTSGWNYSQADAAGSAVSTAEDLAAFVRAHYSGKLFKDPATLEAALAPAAPWFESFSDDYTYLHGGFDKKGFLGHGGGTPGFVSDAGYDPERDMTIVVWSSAEESYGGDGVIHVAHALGLTPSMDEIDSEIFSESEDADELDDADEAEVPDDAEEASA